jgi:hypothetical protein
MTAEPLRRLRDPDLAVALVEAQAELERRDARREHRKRTGRCAECGHKPRKKTT